MSGGRLPDPPATLVVTLAASRADPALGPSGPGARKLVVTSLRPGRETTAAEPLWAPPPDAGAPCPVLVGAATEVATFTEAARQDRHFHRAATEVYLVLQGEMTIEVEGVEHRLAAGDMMVVGPGAVHEVRPAGTRFLCRVVVSNAVGPGDKVVVP